jgi:Putative DNA-binding domain
MASLFEVSLAQALLNPKTPVPEGVVAPDGRNAARRFAVHRNNFVSGLVKTLEARFPAVVKIVGREFFAAMARAFVVERPPRSPLLARFGDTFGDFIATFEPAGDLPYLPDVARIEAARTRAYHAADASPIGAKEMAAQDIRVAASLRFDLHPSLEIVRSKHPVVTIWAMNCGERALEPMETWHPEDALIVRPYLDVEVRLLPPGGASFLGTLAAGRTLNEAAEAALAESPQFDLTDNLAALVGWGLVSRIAEPAERARP